MAKGQLLLINQVRESIQDSEDYGRIRISSLLILQRLIEDRILLIPEEDPCSGHHVNRPLRMESDCS